MIFISNLSDFNEVKETAVTIGKFDGVHLGHHLLFNDIKEYAKKNNLKTVIFTFSTVNKGFLTSQTERLSLIKDLNIDYFIEIPFTEELKSITAKDFIEEILIKKINMKYLSVGEDFRFGYKRSGDIDYLSECSKTYSFGLNVHSKIKFQGKDISSTYIKQAIMSNDLELANAMLGYNYFVDGKIIHGTGMGSSVIGYPTINIIPPTDKLLPANGVYISRAVINDKIYDAISNIGYKPTVSDGNMLGIESFLINADVNVYEEIAKVELLKFVRFEKKFPTIEELKDEITRNVGTAMRYFNR